MPPPYFPQADAPARPVKVTPVPIPTFPGGVTGRPLNISRPASSPARPPTQLPSSHGPASPPPSEDSWAKVGTTHHPKSDVAAQSSPSSHLGSRQSNSHSQTSSETPKAPLTPTRSSRIEVVLSNTPKPAYLSNAPQSNSEDFEDQLVVSDVTPKQPARNMHKLAPLPASDPTIPVLKTLPDAAPTPEGAQTAPPTKRRGRPKGWKPGMSYSGSGTPSGSLKRADRREGNAVNYAVKQRRRGRPPRKPSPMPQEIFAGLQPRYVPFLCEWKGCPAELHNAETLRRHVYVVHGRSEVLECRWAKCGEAAPCPTFSSRERFERHVEERHLVPFTWHLGDGYGNGLGPAEVMGGSDSVPDYLLDENGQQVTPSVKDQEIEDFITWRNNRRRLRELLLQRDQNAPLEDDDGNEISP